MVWFDPTCTRCSFPPPCRTYNLTNSRWACQSLNQNMVLFRYGMHIENSQFFENIIWIFRHGGILSGRVDIKFLFPIVFYGSMLQIMKCTFKDLAFDKTHFSGLQHVQILIECLLHIRNECLLHIRKPIKSVFYHLHVHSSGVKISGGPRSVTLYLSSNLPTGS